MPNFLDTIYNYFWPPVPAPVVQPPVIPPITTTTVCGFAWRPNLNFANIQLADLGTVTAGLYIAVNRNTISKPTTEFDSSISEYPSDNYRVVFEIPAFDNAFSNQLNTLLGGPAISNEVVRRVQGYMKYTHTCLNYIYQTPTGKALLNSLTAANVPVIIIPSYAGNQIQAAGEGRQLIASVIPKLCPQGGGLNGAGDKQILDNALLAASTKSAFNQQCTWLASQIVNAPRYTLFKKDNQFLPRYLYNKKNLLPNNVVINGDSIREWLENGPASTFMQNLSGFKIDGVSAHKIIANAAIVALYDNVNDQNPGNQHQIGSTIQFDVKDYSVNTLEPTKTWVNGLTDRPPGIGLAHELIHSYHNARGSQPGKQDGDPTTTLTELICVGLVPWKNADITENQIRDEWANVTFEPWDTINSSTAHGRVKRREYYTDPPPPSASLDIGFI